MVKISQIVGLAISLIVIAVIVPIGLAYISGADATNVTIGNTTQTVEEWVDPTVLTLLTVLVPIMAVVGIIMYFVPRTSGIGQWYNAEKSLEQTAFALA